MKSIYGKEKKTNKMEKNKEYSKEGTKNDRGKLQWHLLSFRVLADVVRVMMFGAFKYGEYNWQEGIKYSRVWDAANRHLKSWWEGEDVDEETKITHIAHAICCCMFLAWYQIFKPNFDDRPKNK